MKEIKIRLYTPRELWVKFHASGALKKIEELIKKEVEKTE